MKREVGRVGGKRGGKKRMGIIETILPLSKTFKNLTLISIKGPTPKLL